MARRKEPARVVGPYQEGDRWRVVVVENGRRENHFAEDRQAARRLIARLRRKLEAQDTRVGMIVDEYTEHRLRVASAKPSSVMHTDQRIRLMLGSWLDRPVADLTPAKAAAVYEEHVAKRSRLGRPFAAATHRWDLRMIRGLFRWALKQGRVSSDPFADVLPVGRAKVGKPQLRIDEARRFHDAALAAFENGHQLALAAACALWLGLRASEVMKREVRDLDDGGRVLWVPSGKTANARRRLVVPEALRGPLLRQAGGRPGCALLFPGETGRGYRRASLNEAVARLCRRAGLPVVCAHSLRGLHSTLALGAGATADAVASALGHGSFAVTQRHYAAPGSVEAAAASRVADVLGSSGDADLLRSLDETTLRELLAILAERRRR